jgi:hypothetical protein
MPFTQHGKAFFQKASLPGCFQLAFGDIYEISTSFRSDSAGEKEYTMTKPFLLF